MKTAFAIAFASLLTSSLSFAQTPCRFEGEASISNFAIEPNTSIIFAGGPEDEWKGTEKFTKLGRELGTSVGIIEGDDIVFRGRPSVIGGMMYGAYPDWDGTEVLVRSQVEVSIDWKPDQREVCTKHRSILGGGRRCVEKGIETFPTSFVLDLTTDVGQRRHYVKQFININRASHATITMPALRCYGPVEKFEVRLLDLTGGEVEFRVHKVKYSAGWN